MAWKIVFAHFVSFYFILFFIYFLDLFNIAGDLLYIAGHL